MATIGLKDVHYAMLLTDPVTGTPTYGSPVSMAGAITASINANSSAETLFADDGPSDTASTLGEIELELNMADLSLAVQAALLGHTLVNGILKRKSSDTPPWLAIGFRSLKSNGAYRYVWLNKGKFAVPEEEYNTKGDSIEFTTPKISGKFVKRDNDDEWKRETDEDVGGFNPSYVTTWFLSPLTITGVFDTGTYVDVTVTISALAALAGKILILSADDDVEAGDETAAWVADTLTVVLAGGVVYSRVALQAIIDEATGTSPGAITILTSSHIIAVEATSLTLTLATT